jgi:hypothetical protein
MAHDDSGERVTALLTLRYGRGNGTEPWDPADYLHAFGNLRDALLYAALFLPEFVEVEGFVLLKELGAQPKGGWAEVAGAIKRARETSTEALKRCVDSFNWVEVPYVVVDDGSASEQEIEVLAGVIAQGWRGQLRDRFPDRCFVVRIHSPTETGSVIGVGFEQITTDR